jgi:O-antigen ligase
VIWYFWPQVGWWPVILAVIPWFARALVGLPPIRFTKFDPALLIFFFTALVAVWATYDPDAGLAKFWLILGSILLYYALAGQTRTNLWAVIKLIALISSGVALYFLLSHDWQTQSADILLIHRAGMWWMGARPLAIAQSIHPNIAGGLLALFLPFYVALGMRAWRKQSIRLGLFVFLTGMISVVGLLMTSSRAAWLALAIALGIWLLWGLSSYLARVVSSDRRFVFGVALLIAVVVVSLIGLRHPGGMVGIVGNLPGSDTAVSRLEIAGNTVKLIADYPFTGGGLASFPGLYSKYMIIVPFFLFSYSHNMYLDIALEQGILALIVYLVVLGGTVWQLGKGRRYRRLKWAIFASLIVMVIHGFADDPLYGIQGTPFLFLLTGITVVVTRSRSSPPQEDQSAVRLKRRTWLRNGIVVGLPLLVFLIFALGGVVLAIWYANLGAVDMARVELQDFPSANWQENQYLDPLSPAIETFHKSLMLDGGNFTAQYRMGMIAMQARDFVLAKSYLEPAYVVKSEHRGVRKVLGYCYVWLGEFDKAAQLLSDIPEARQELRAYSAWWQRQGRQDLSENSEQVAEMLERMGTVLNQQ